jgi:hypothetical protein
VSTAQRSAPETTPSERAGKLFFKESLMSEKLARLIVHCEEHLANVRKFADETGQRAQLERALENAVWDGLYTHLYADWAPYSFFFVMKESEHKNPDLTTQFFMNGGLIYHGQTPNHGEAQLSICLTPTSGWAMHT